MEMLNLPVEQRGVLSKEARRWPVEWFSVKRMIKELMNVYDGVLHRQGALKGT